jgi:hypothetical protein
MLGFSSYEALQPMHRWEQQIREGIVHELSCPFQGGRPVLRHKNTLVTVDLKKGVILGRVLNNGDEREFLSSGISGAQSIRIDGTLLLVVEESPESANRLNLSGYVDGKPHLKVLVNVIATQEGLVVNAYEEDTDTGELDDLGSMGLDFSDAQEEDAIDTVNQAALKYTDGPKCIDNSFHQWMREVNEAGELRYLSYGDWVEDKPAPTSFMFASEALARDFVTNNGFDLEPEDFEGLILVRRTTELA